MLRFLTQKLKSQSLNEDQQEEFENKAQDDHDSGTESDDESGDTNGFPGDNNVMEHEEESDWGGNGLYQLPGRGSIHCYEEVGPGAGEMMMMMGGGGGGGRDSASSQFESGYNIDSALPSDSDHAYDHHSSEEELEVINSTSYDEVDDEVNLPEGDDLLNGDADADDSSLPGGGRGSSENCKRKWSQMASNRLSVESTSSSDDEVQGLLRPLSTPVEFRTSPPVDAHKPSRSQSPPPKLFLFSGPTPPIVSSSTASLLGDDASVAAIAGVATTVAPDGSAGATSPISSNVVSSSIITSSVPGALTMSGRNHGVFRGIRRYSDYTNSDGYPPFSIISSTSLLVTNNNTGGEDESGGGGLAMERSDGLLSRSHNLTLTNSNETPSTFTNLTTTASALTNNSTLMTSTTTGAFGKVTSRSGNGGGGSTKESSRKRHRHHNPRHIQRPWLDFEKMQQLKARSVTTWRSGGELSLYCS